MKVYDDEDYDGPFPFEFTDGIMVFYLPERNFSMTICASALKGDPEP